jgi:16S rRNA (guanine966-N2)-methyltransferase
VRISGGVWRSRRLRGPGRGHSLRPTPDALRERGFAVLGDRVEGIRFLDLYAGTGAVGLEALSRGARQVVFVERHRRATRLIEANYASFETTPDRARVLARPVVDALALLARDPDRFQIAWADPPFDAWEDGFEALVQAFEGGVLAAQGIACLECPDKARLELPESLTIERDLRGGASRLVMIERK